MEMKAREALETHNQLGKVYMTMRNRQAEKVQTKEVQLPIPQYQTMKLEVIIQ
jgi:hypothetical protein